MRQTFAGRQRVVAGWERVEAGGRAACWTAVRAVRPGRGRDRGGHGGRLRSPTRLVDAVQRRRRGAVRRVAADARDVAVTELVADYDLHGRQCTRPVAEILRYDPNSLGRLGSSVCRERNTHTHTHTRTHARTHARFGLHVKYTDIAKFAGHLPHRYGNSRAIWDHTVLPAIRQR